MMCTQCSGPRSSDAPIGHWDAWGWLYMYCTDETKIHANSRPKHNAAAFTTVLLAHDHAMMKIREQFKK